MSKPFYKRRWLWVAALVVMIPVAAIGWYLFSPLFINKTCNEAFPLAAGAEVRSNKSCQDVEDEMAAAAATSASSEEAMPDGMIDATILAAGAFADADSSHRGSGDATIYELADGSRVLRLENLDVTNGPDLHVILSPANSPESRDEVSSGNYIDLGGLKGNRGNQNYVIPDDFEIPTAGSVVIYCKPFHVIFSVASLASPA